MKSFQKNSIFSSLFPTNASILISFITLLFWRQVISNPTCVDDVYPSGCPPANPNCYGGVCIGTCTGNTIICSSFATPVCDSSGHCVSCSGDGDCTTKFPGTQCIGTPPSTYCGECLLDTDCTSPTTPKCQSNKMCGGCTADSDCSRFPGKTKCNTGNGECVECFSDNNACTNTALSTCSSNVCSACLGDGDCSHMTGGNVLCASGGVCGVCKTNSDCSSYSNSECSITSTTSTCTPCSGDSGCSHFTNNKFCRSGHCGECKNNTDCTSITTPRCDLTPLVSVCAACQVHSDCSRFSGKSCVSGTCYECATNANCTSPTNSSCHPSLYYCQACSADSECSHLSPKQYCTTSSVCKSVKVLLINQSSDRVTPEKRIAFIINVDPYPSNGSSSYSWSLSQPGLTFRESTSQRLEIRAFGDIIPLPSSLTITYTISNSLGDSDTLSRTINLNRIPYGGTLSVSPATGEALNTVFTLTASGWTDPEGEAIYYKYYFATDENREFVPLNAFSSSNTLSTKLPPGLLKNQYDIYVRVVVIDPYNIEAIYDTKVQVTLPLKTVDELLTELQTLASGSLSTAYGQAVLIASYMKQLENEIINSPLNTCPICSHQGSCTNGVCVCNSGYTLPGCSITQTEYDKIIALKDKVMDVTISELTNVGISARVSERSFHVIRALTSNRLFTPDTITNKGLNQLESILSSIVTSSTTVRIDALRDGLKAIENLFGFTLENCTRTTSFASNLLSKFNGLINYFSAIEVKMYNTTDPYVIEANTFYLCIQQDVRASTLKGKKIFMCDGASMEFPTGGVNLPDTSYVDIQLLVPKPNYRDCAGSSINLSPYQSAIKQYKTPSTLVSPNGVLIINLRPSVSVSCAAGMIAVENAAGDVSCKEAPNDSNELESLILGSNIKKLGNVGALLDFNIFTSLLFYIVVGFTLVMVGVSVWSVYKDRHLDRDVIVLPKKSPSNFYRLMVYLLISHTFFGIFALFDKDQPRIMRSVLFYIKILGMMSMSAIFNQTEKDLGIVQKIIISIITLVCITPVNQIIGYLVFKRQLQPKMRRKRLALQTRKVKTPAEKKAEEKQKKFTKLMNTFGYSMVFLVILGYLYIVFVITANNVQTNKSVVSKWLEGFLQSTGLDFFGIQIVQVFIHLGIISTLQQENKKKFLCIPKRHLPMLLNPNILDYKKRFAALDRLYKDGLADQVDETEIEGEETLESSPYFPPRMNRINQGMMRSSTRKPTLKGSSNMKAEIPEVKIELNETTEHHVASESPKMPEVRLNQTDDSPNRTLETTMTQMQTEGAVDTNENSPGRSPKRSLSRHKTIRSRKTFKERSPTIELKTDLNE